MPQVALPIIDQLVHPSFGLTTLSAPLASISGNGTLTPPQNPLVALTYGITLSVFTAPAQWGRIIGNPDQFHPAYCQLSVDYTDLTAHTFNSQVQWMDVDGSYYWWEEPLPTDLRYHVQPGFVLIPRWVQT